MNKFIQQIEIQVVLKREGRKQFHRRGIGADLIQALQYFQSTQTGIKAGMFQEICDQMVQAAEYIKSNHRGRAATRKAGRDKVTEILKNGQVIGYKRNGKVMSDAQVKEWLKKED